jgi:hypothetical protein
MSDKEIHVRVTPALHPSNVDAIEGLDDTTRPYLAPVATVMDEAYQAIEAIYKAREAAAKNEAWTDAQRLLQVADFAHKHQQRVLKQVDSLMQNLDKAIKATDEMLQGPLEQQSGLGTINEEIRRHIKSMSTEERHNFLKEANANGDTKTMTAVLGAPHYLSGMQPAEQQYYLREFHMQRNPDAARRLKVMTAARDLLNERSPLIFGQVEKAVGQPWRKVDMIRKAATAAEQALIIRDKSSI